MQLYHKLLFVLTSIKMRKTGQSTFHKNGTNELNYSFEKEKNNQRKKRFGFVIG